MYSEEEVKLYKKFKQQNRYNRISFAGLLAGFVMTLRQTLFQLAENPDYPSSKDLNMIKRLLRSAR